MSAKRLVNYFFCFLLTIVYRSFKHDDDDDTAPATASSLIGFAPRRGYLNQEC